MDFKRVTLVCGHYGSGKTNLAVNLALRLREKRDNVAAADLDIVNPYFRTLDSAELFREKGIKLICSPYANTNLDAPALPQEIYSITDDRTQSVIVDVGGDDRGALALGRISGSIAEENDYEMLMVVNMYRPLTGSVEDVLEIRDEIEAAGRLKFTGIINNSNLGRETTSRDVLASLEYAEGISEAAGLPMAATSYDERLDGELRDLVPEPFPMALQKFII